MGAGQPVLSRRVRTGRLAHWGPAAFERPPVVRRLRGSQRPEPPAATGVTAAPRPPILRHPPDVVIDPFASTAGPRPCGWKTVSSGTAEACARAAGERDQGDGRPTAVARRLAP